MNSVLLKSSRPERVLVFISLSIIATINLPFLLGFPDFYTPFAYDSLDSNLVWFKILLESGKIFSNNSAIIEPAMNALPRVAYPGEFSVELLLYYLFNPPTAYIINIIFIQLIAFAGMVLLLKDVYKNEPYSLWLIYAIALIFSCLKFWPHTGISVAGLPLFIYAYNRSKEKFLVSFLIMLFYVLYSSFILTGIFLIAILSVYQLFKIITKDVNRNQIIFTCSFILIYLMVSYRLVLSAIFPVFISHRSDLIFPTFNLAEALKVLFNMIFREYGHNLKHAPFIMLLTFLWLAWCIFRKIEIKKIVIHLILLILSLSLISVLMQSTFVYNLYSKLSFLKQIQLQRFYWLLPPLFYILFFAVLNEIWMKAGKKFLVPGLLLIQFIIVIHVNTNWRQFFKTQVLGYSTEILTFNKFYSTDLYSRIKEHIGLEQSTYRVASLGLHPAVALYNGFYTIDGYFPNYPKAHKDDFYQIHKEELEKNQIIKDFFLNVGSICVILSDEMIQKLHGKGFVVPAFRKNKENVINDLKIDTRHMLQMNARYLLSAFRIMNANELNMVLDGYFENETSPWGIYLYSINIDETLSQVQ